MQTYDYETILPLSVIRQHTKTDDVPVVSDEMLVLYRKAALEAAQQYTGLPLSARFRHTQYFDVEPFSPQRDHMGGIRPSSMFTLVQLDYPVSDGVVLYRGVGNYLPERLTVAPNSTKIRVPRNQNIVGYSCPGHTIGKGRLDYTAGFSSEDDIPAAVKLGALKYIAHVIENPGDTPELAYGLQPVTIANPAMSSGAVDIWHTVRREFF